MTSIADQVAELDRQMTSQAPAEALAVFADDRAALSAAGTPDGVATPGTPMPDGALLRVDGSPTTLDDTRAGRPAVVVLYRGAWCPFCNLTLKSYQSDLLPALAERDVALVAISPQHPDGSLTMQETHDLGFAVLSDPGLSIAGRLGIVVTPSAEVLEVQQQMGLSLADVNADGTTALPMPTVAVVDADGVLRWIDVHRDYSSRTEVADILAAVDDLG